MAHGKHRRTKRTASNDLRPRPAAERAMLRALDGLDALAVAFVEGSQKSGRLSVSDPAPAERALLIEQDHMVHDGDAVEQTFNLMACVHPAQCTCETDYPNWRPGLR